jgi:hypothetical protein
MKRFNKEELRIIDEDASDLFHRLRSILEDYATTNPLFVHRDLSIVLCLSNLLGAVIANANDLETVDVEIDAMRDVISAHLRNM